MKPSYAASPVLTIALIAATAYEARRAYAETVLQDHGRPAWDHASKHLQESVTRDVEFVRGNPTCTPSDVHDAWCIGKMNDGWSLGDKKSDVEKTHPGLTEWTKLPPEHQAKKAIITAVAKSLLAAFPVEQPADASEDVTDKGGSPGAAEEALDKPAANPTSTKKKG